MATNGLILRTNMNFSDNTLPVYQNDQLLTSGNGSLFLSDVRTMAAGVPTNGLLLTNLAASKAAAVGVVGDTSGKWVQIGDLVGGGNAILERTGKGGIHVIVSAVNTIANGNAFRMQIPLALTDYMVANRTHNFYYSQWRNITRAWATVTSAPCFAGIEYSNTSRFMRMTAASGQTFPNGGFLLGSRITPARNTVGVGFENNAGTCNPADTLTTSGFNSDAVSRDLGQWGRSPTQNNAFATGFPSMIFYRGYIEDLTVSGRTYAQVDAIDKAMFDAAFATGGRFNGDTFTPPSTLP